MYDDVSQITNIQKVTIISDFLERCIQLNSWIDIYNTYCECISKENIIIHIRGINFDSRRGTEAVQEYRYDIPAYIFFSSKNLKEWLKEQKIKEHKENEEYQEYQRLKKKFEKR